MRGLVVYQFATYIRSHRYIPPVSVFIMMLVINYTYVPNPILDSYSFTSILLFFVIGWVTISIFHSEDEGQKQITIMHAKNIREYYLALVINCTLVAFFLSVLAVAYPVIFQAFTPGLHPVHIVKGFLAHFCLAFISIALSIFFTRELVKNHINSWWGVISILIGSLVSAVMTEADVINITVLHWILPPLHYSFEIMSVEDQIISINTEIYGYFGWIFIYSMILITLFLMIVQKKEVL